MSDWRDNRWTSAAAALGGAARSGYPQAVETANNTKYSFIALFAGPSLPTLRPQTSALLSSIVASAPVYKAPLAAPVPAQWIYVTRRFDLLIENIGIRQDEVDAGMKKAMRVVASLNRAYYNVSSGNDNAFLLGSWSKQTRVRPFSDLDLMFVLPWNMYHRFDTYVGNKQSSLLQNVRENLAVTYSRTEIRSDRHVVMAEVDDVLIEVVPSFALANGQYWICDTKDNGSYKTADPDAEVQALVSATAKYNDNARQLTRLLKKWQIENNVKIASFQLERLAIKFLESWSNNTRDRFWYDWMMRDFFLYMRGCANTFIQMPGTGEWIPLGTAWFGAATLAYANACAACTYEQANNQVAAGRSWQKIFGYSVPVIVG